MPECAIMSAPSTTMTTTAATMTLVADNNSKSAQALVEVRQKFLEWANQNPDKVNDRDKYKLATDDWYLKRYLLARSRKVDETLKMLKQTMEWRNEFGIHISEDAMFPQEFYKIGALFPYENDKNGNMVLYLRIKYHKKVVEMVEVEKHFLVHTFEKIDRLTNGSGLVLVFDCQSASYANCDIEFLQFLISAATEHAPVGLQYLIVYKMPWFLNAFWGIARKLLPAYLANRIKFCDETTIDEFIAPENRPDFMDGTCNRNYRWIPPGSPSIFKLANAHGITNAEIDKILPQFQKFLDESDDALAKKNYDNPPSEVSKYVNNPQTAPNLLSDMALFNIGLATRPAGKKEAVAAAAIKPQLYQTDQHGTINAQLPYASIIRIFPNEFIDFNYDSYNDAFHGSVTLLNPSKVNALAFKMMSNRPSSYSVKPCRGVLAPETSITLSLILLDEHRSTDKFLIMAQQIEGEVESITRNEFDELWTQNADKTCSIKLASSQRKITPTKQTFNQNLSAARNPHIQELALTCNSLKRTQSFFVIINIMLVFFIISMFSFIDNASSTSTF